MRSVTFVDRLTLEINGDVAQHGVCLADVNGDGDHELVVGTDNGDLLIYKGDTGVVWRRCSELGFITALGVGDMLHLGHSVLVVVSGCGFLTVIDLHDDTDNDAHEVDIKYVVFNVLSVNTSLF